MCYRKSGLEIGAFGIIFPPQNDLLYALSGFSFGNPNTKVPWEMTDQKLNKFLSTLTLSKPL